MWLAAEVWAFAGEEANRVAFTLKAGLAMLLVSLLVLVGEPYMLYGTNVDRLVHPHRGHHVGVHRWSVATSPLTS